MKRSLSQQVGILSLGQLLAYAVMFFVPLVNVRALSIEHYGYYRQFWLVFETLAPLLMLGIPRSLMYFLPRAESQDEKAAYITQTIGLLLVTSLCAVGVYAVMGSVLGHGLGALVRGFFWRLCVFTIFMVTTSYMDWLFVAERKVGRQAVYHVLTSSSQAVVVMLTAWFKRDVSAIVWSLTIFTGVKFLFALGYTVAVHRPALRLISMRTLREQLSFAVPIGLSAMALVLLNQTDKFIINRFLGREAFAIYSVGAFQVPFVNMIRGSIINVIFPLMAQHHKAGNHDAILDLYRRALAKTAVLFFPVFVFLEVSARPFITILFTDAYADATPIFMIYLLLFLRSTVETGTIIQVYKKTAFLFRTVVLSFFANLVLSILLFKMIGREGVPWATVITMFSLSAITLLYGAKLLGTSVKEMLPVAMLARVAVAAVLPGAGLWALYLVRAPAGILHLGAAAILYFATYLVICLLARLVTLDDFRSLLERRAP
ncbi:MAG: oligosaccharide flippase family protein [Candidatus Krumholzibacteria bacterium]|nr:oligosaccharide flippase family protein [Candidatus Krumholzibacteria bacterium]